MPDDEKLDLEVDEMLRLEMEEVLAAALFPFLGTIITAETTLAIVEACLAEMRGRPTEIASMVSSIRHSDAD